MRTFSRNMPRAPEVQPVSWPTLLLAAALAAGLLWQVSPAVVIAAAAAVGLISVTSALLHRRLRRVAADRAGESICTFARAFDRRAVDPWIVRAVHEEAQAQLGGGEPFPLRASDRLAADLGIAGDDLDDLAQTVAQRTGRVLDGVQHDVEIATVADLVLFLDQLPRGPAH